MEIIKGFFLITLIIGIILLAVYFISFAEISSKCDSKIIYKYIPRTLEEEETINMYQQRWEYVLQPMLPQH